MSHPKGISLLEAIIVALIVLIFLGSIFGNAITEVEKERAIDPCLQYSHLPISEVPAECYQYFNK